MENIIKDSSDFHDVTSDKKVRVIVVEDDKDFKEKFCDLCGDTTHYHGECKK